MDIIQQNLDLEHERYSEINNLRRKSRQTGSGLNFLDLEEAYACVRNIHSRLISKDDDWTKLLDTDEQGDPVYPKES